jgi:hypothetical protein
MVAFSREHDHRHGRDASDLFQNFEAVPPRQHYIEYYYVAISAGQQIEPLVPGVRAGETKSLGREIIVKQLAEFDIVVYYKDIFNVALPPRRIVMAWVHYNQTSALFYRVPVATLHFFAIRIDI